MQAEIPPGRHVNFKGSLDIPGFPYLFDNTMCGFFCRFDSSEQTFRHAISLILSGEARNPSHERSQPTKEKIFCIVYYTINPTGFPFP